MLRSVWGQEVILPWPSRTQAETGLRDRRVTGLPGQRGHPRRATGQRAGDDASLSLEPVGWPGAWCQGQAPRVPCGQDFLFLLADFNNFIV